MRLTSVNQQTKPNQELIRDAMNGKLFAITQEYKTAHDT